MDVNKISNSVCFSLDRDTFNHIVKESTIKRRERFENFVSKIEILSELVPYERGKITDCLISEKFSADQKIIVQGDKGDKFYFIEEGTCVAKKLNDGVEDIVYEYKENDYFGELALLNDEPRAASIYATSEVVQASIDRNAFKRLLGPLESLLERNKEKYDKFVANLKDLPVGENGDQENNSKPKTNEEPPAVKQCKIKTQVQNRYEKEYLSYQKEVEELQTKLEKIQQEGDENEIKKHTELLEESKQQLPNISGKITNALRFLEKFLEENGQDEDLMNAKEVYTNAKDQVIKTKEFLDSLEKN